MKKIKNILVPTDFSKHAEIAMDYAIGLAKQAKGKLILMHASELVPAAYAGEKTIIRAYNKQTIVHVAEKLDLMKNIIHKAEHIPVEVKLYDGSVKESIREACTDFDISLVVMGTLGESGVKEKLFGSKTASVIGKLKVPLLVIPFTTTFRDPKDIVIALDNFDEPRENMMTVIEMAHLFYSRLHVCVFTDKRETDISMDGDFKNQFSIFKKYFETRYNHLTIQSFNLDRYKFGDSLHNYIEHHKVDMLAMVSHNQPFLKEIFHHDLAKKMSYEINIPLLALPG
jgi:nucleotide-binding universal stress UspA family protein